MVSRKTIRFHKNLVVYYIVIELDLSMNDILELCLAIRYEHTNNIWLSISDSLFDLCLTKV